MRFQTASGYVWTGHHFQDVDKIHVWAAKINHGITSGNAEEDLSRRVKCNSTS